MIDQAAGTGCLSPREPPARAPRTGQARAVRGVRPRAPRAANGPSTGTGVRDGQAGECEGRFSGVVVNETVDNGFVDALWFNRYAVNQGSGSLRTSSGESRRRRVPAAPLLPARRLDAVLRFPGRRGHLLSRAAILVNCARAASRSSAISAASTSGGGSESVSPRLLSLIRNKSRLSLSPQGTGHFRIFPTGGFANQVWSPADGRRRFRTHDHRSRGAGGRRRRQARGVPLPSALPVGRRADTRDSNSSPVAHSMIQSLTRSRSSHAVKPSSRSDRRSAVGAPNFNAA